MKKLVLLAVITAIAIGQSVMAGETYKTTKEVIEPAPVVPCIDGGEFILGLFAGGVIVENTLQGYDDSFAGGVEALYAVTRNLVVGAEYYAFSSEPAHSYAGVVQVRFPFDCFAPYVFGTAGGLVDGNNSFAVGAGGGVEYRFAPSVGVFTDGRYVWADGSDEQHIFIRGGVRFAF